MARTRRTDYLRSNRARTVPLRDPGAARAAAVRLLAAQDAPARRRLGQDLLASLSQQTDIPAPELVVPDEHQPHRRRGGRIVFSLQGEYRRRVPSASNPAVSRDGRPLGRIRVPNRTPARGSLVRASAFLNTLLHEFCHHHDAEALALKRSLHTAGFYARIRHLKEQIEPRVASHQLASQAVSSRAASSRVSSSRAASPRAASPQPAAPRLARLWTIIRNL